MPRDEGKQESRKEEWELSTCYHVIPRGAKSIKNRAFCWSYSRTNDVSEIDVLIFTSCSKFNVFIEK
jgi:hypothetical protein